MDERGDELDTLELSSNDYVLQSVAYALYTTIEREYDILVYLYHAKRGVL